MEPAAFTTCDPQVPHSARASSRKRAGGFSSKNFGFDPSAWDPLFPLAAEIEEKLHRAVCRRLTEVHCLLRQAEGGRLDPLPGQEVEGFAFCLVDEYVARNLTPDLPRSRLLQLVARCALSGDPKTNAGVRSHWFYLNLMVRRFHEWRATAGLEGAVRRALESCSPALARHPRVARELAQEFVRLVIDSPRPPSRSRRSRKAYGGSRP